VGLSLFDKQLRAVFQEGIDNGLFVRNGNESIFVPKVANIPSADVAARDVTGITFYFPLAGAVHSVAIAGTVSV